MNKKVLATIRKNGRYFAALRWENGTCYNCDTPEKVDNMSYNFFLKFLSLFNEVDIREELPAPPSVVYVDIDNLK